MVRSGSKFYVPLLDSLTLTASNCLDTNSMLEFQFRNYPLLKAASEIITRQLKSNPSPIFNAPGCSSARIVLSSNLAFSGICILKLAYIPSLSRANAFVSTNNSSRAKHFNIRKYQGETSIDIHRGASGLIDMNFSLLICSLTLIMFCSCIGRGRQLVIIDSIFIATNAEACPQTIKIRAYN